MDRLTDWLTHHRWRALAIFVSLCCFYIFIAHVVPNFLALYNMYTHLQDIQQNIHQVEDWEIEQQQVNVRKRMLQQHFSSLYVSLPKSDQMSNILSELQAHPDEKDLRIHEIRPGERTSFTHYDELPFQMVIRGNFHHLVGFISRIERSSYVIKVKEVNLHRMEESMTDLEARLSLSVIILKGKGGG